MRWTERLAAIPAGRVSKWWVLVAWLAIAAVAFVVAPRLTDEQVNDASSFLPSTAESTQVVALEAQFRTGEELPAFVVYQRTDGITPADRATVADDIAAFEQVDRVVAPLPPPIPSADGQALLVTVPIDIEGDFRATTTTVDALREIAVDADGLTVRVTGPAGSTGDFLRAFRDLNATLLLFTILVVTAVLLVTYRSPVLWLVPVFTVMVAVQTAKSMNWVLASNDVIIVNGQTVSILLVLVFGAGTDYALLLISRYREELRAVDDRHVAMATALRHTAGAITASAFTVAAALLMLRFSSLESTRGLGPAGAIGVLCAWAAALTLLPALLVALGRWVFWPFIPRTGDAAREESGVWARLGDGIARRPRPVWAGTSLVLLAIAAAALLLDPTGLTDREVFRTTPPSVEGQEIVQVHYDAGSASPLVAIGSAAQADDWTAALAASPAVAEVSEPVVAAGLAKVDVTLSVPLDPASAYPAVRELRTLLDETPGKVLLGGDVAIAADTSAAAARDRLVVIPLVLGVVLLILVLLLRALAAPVMLIATVLLSFFATLGICTLLFGALFGSTRGDVNFPLFAFIFLVALGVDYNIFLMTRVREESLVHGTHDGVLRGLAVTGGVITSAGVVLAATFAVLATLPLTALFQIGVTVAVGVLLDAFVVRSVLVPALALDIGDRIWWPSDLSRGTTPPAAPPVASDDGRVPA